MTTDIFIVVIAASFWALFFAILTLAEAYNPDGVFSQDEEDRPDYPYSRKDV